MKRLDLWVEPSVHQARKQLPGHIRQRVKQVIASLADDPQPHNSCTLDVTGLDTPPGVEFRRVRLERWRVIYAVHEAEQWCGSWVYIAARPMIMKIWTRWRHW
jgi:mRNA-degrading endonuclease RelE of RelBE toxin-antitoxin system